MPQKNDSSPNKRPLQIYLDSSDYSSIAEGKNDSAYKHLIKLIEANDIEIRYSFVTVSEFLQTEKKYQEYAIKRATIINSLCRSKVLPPLYELMVNDCIHYFHRHPSEKQYRKYALRDNDRWFPHLRGFLDETKSEIISSIMQDMERLANGIKDRNQRAQAKSKLKLAVKNNNLTDFGLTLMKGTEKWLTDQLPISDPAALKDITYKFFKGDITADELSNILAKQCFNPLNLAAWTVDNMESSIENFQWMRTAGTGLNTKVQGMRQSISKIQELEKAQGISERSTLEKIQTFQFAHQELRTETLNKLFIKHAEAFDKEGITAENRAEILASPLKSIPSFDVLRDSFEIYVKDSVITQNRKLKPSDYGDIQHSVYIPYVDVFRADKYMSQFYKPIGEKYDTQVCSSLEELIEVVEEMRK